MLLIQPTCAPYVRMIHAMHAAARVFHTTVSLRACARSVLYPLLRQHTPPTTTLYCMLRLLVVCVSYCPYVRVPMHSALQYNTTYTLRVLCCAACHCTMHYMHCAYPIAMHAHTTTYIPVHWLRVLRISIRCGMHVCMLTHARCYALLCIHAAHCCNSR